ncbi:MAG: hypothetical protein GXP41_04180 [Chloroflexi bacterium]|nr:hypothetical protein [Chloroflexota bacterium]
MTELLEKAVAEVSKLPRQEQNTIAAWLLEELASERRWDKAFAESADVLAKLGEEALAEYHAGL